MIGQFGLDAGDVVREFPERSDYAAQLQGLREILRVVDGDDVAGGEFQSVVAGLRFGARLGRRHQQGGDALRGDAWPRGVDGDLVVSFEQQQNLQLVGRVVQLCHRLNQVGNHLGLVVGRHQDRVSRELIVRQAERFLIGDADWSGRQPAPEDEHPVGHRENVSKSAQSEQCDCRLQWFPDDECKNHDE